MTSWARLARLVTGRPLASLVIAACILGTLAVPVLQLRTADPNTTDLPANAPVRVAYDAIDHAFPGTPDPAALVVRGRAPRKPGRAAPPRGHGPARVARSPAVTGA